MWTPQKEKFAQGILDGSTQTEAYRNAYDCSNMLPKTVWAEASRLAHDPEVIAWIAERKQKALERLEIKQADVLRELWQIATADPNELTQIRRNCCRYCYGWRFGYQWKDELEYAEACQVAIEAGKPVPEMAGGDGFDGRLDPNPECPECHGDGVAEVVFADTRKLKGSARRLFAGVKQTKFGLEIIMRDQDAALVNIGRHLGLFNDKLLQPGAGDPGASIPDKATIENADATMLSRAYREVMG